MMTPWGTAHSIERLEDGVIRVTTATHGAIRLSEAHQKQIEPGLRTPDRWYEKDSELFIVADAFPHLFPDLSAKMVAEYMEAWFPGRRISRHFHGSFGGTVRELFGIARSSFADCAFRSRAVLDRSKFLRKFASRLWSVLLVALLLRIGEPPV